MQVAAVRAAVAAGRLHSVLCFSHDACTAVRVRKRNSLRSNSFFLMGTGTKIKNFFMVILIPKLSLNFVVALAAGLKSKPSSRERFFLRTANPKRSAAHRRPGPERGVAAYRRTPEREQTIFYPNHL